MVQRRDYDEFGNVTLDTSLSFQPFGFTGGLEDLDTKLVQFGARDYDPQAGRWTSKDPISFRSGQLNHYIYVRGDPINNVDPRGESLAAVGPIVTATILAVEITATGVSASILLMAAVDPDAAYRAWEQVKGNAAPLTAVAVGAPLAAGSIAVCAQAAIIGLRPL